MLIVNFLTNYSIDPSKSFPFVQFHECLANKLILLACHHCRRYFRIYRMNQIYLSNALPFYTKIPVLPDLCDIIS